MTTEHISPCPNCGSSEVYLSTAGQSGGGYAPNYLRGLGRFLHIAKLYSAVCESCGLTRFFAEAEARKRLRDSHLWRKV